LHVTELCASPPFLPLGRDLPLYERILNIPNFIDNILRDIKILKETAVFVCTFHDFEQNEYSLTYLISQ
jgi:hypothetical protein